jgi:bifunctional ADP-heptose synthase (sugar kinase/adenylyltransferase)
VEKKIDVIGIGAVYAVSLIGSDSRGFELERALRGLGIETELLATNESRATPTYTKPIYDESPPRELNRLDIKNFSPTPPHLEDEIISQVRKISRKADAVVIMDQVSEENFGVITARVRDFLIGLAKASPSLIMFADSRSRIDKFSHMIIKGNEKEKTDIPGTASRLAGKPFFVTLGEKGALAVENGTAALIPPFPVTGPTDICGAGDAFTAGAVAALCCGASFAEAGIAGNLLASICVGQVGTTGQATAGEMMDRHKKFQ